MFEARAGAKAALNAFSRESFRAAAMLPASFLRDTPSSVPISMNVSLYGEHAVLQISISESCSLVERAGYVSALSAIGIQTLILAGTGAQLADNFNVPLLVPVADHINLLGDNPLIGPHDVSFGPRFPDMSEPYAKELQEHAAQRMSGAACVYAGCSIAELSKPNFRAHLVRLGADFAGPWIVPETIAARQAGIKVLAFVTPAGADYGGQDVVSRAVYSEMREVCAQILSEVRA